MRTDTFEVLLANVMIFGNNFLLHCKKNSVAS
jgi:hypothetical protein